MARVNQAIFVPAFSLLLALLLSVLPLPQGIESFRPDWVAIVLLYWSLMSPERFGLLTALFMGLMLDTLTGSLLGQHSLALLVIVYLSQRFHLRIRVFPASQLVLTIVGLLAVYEFILFWIDGVAGRTVPIIERWAPIVTGAVLWFLLLVVFERRRQDVAARM